jgi:hypothetical protein
MASSAYRSNGTPGNSRLIRLKASQTSRFGMSNGFTLFKRLLPSLVGLLPGLNTTAPSVQHHYSAFFPTTSCSVPVLCIGTQSLAGITPSARSLHIRATGSHIPYESLIQIHAAFEPDAARAGLQVSALACPGAITGPGFDINCTLSAVHRRFAFARLSGPYLTGSCPVFSAMLTTIALNDSSSRWCGADS